MIVVVCRYGGVSGGGADGDGDGWVQVCMMHDDV